MEENVRKFIQNITRIKVFIFGVIIFFNKIHNKGIKTLRIRLEIKPVKNPIASYGASDEIN
ncbi:MAG: hypothetical protein AABW75_02970 [Nanoarchaeota archaeon]